MKNKWFRKGLVVGIILLFIGVSVIPSTGINVKVSKPSIMSLGGNTLYVGGAGPGNYTKIQDAIDNASNGDTLYVYNGEFEGFTTKKTLSLIGESKNDTIIISNPKYGRRIELSADWINFENFKVIGTYSSIYAALQTDGNYITISNCNIVGGKYGNYN